MINVKIKNEVGLNQRQALATGGFFLCRQGGRDTIVYLHPPASAQLGRKDEGFQIITYGSHPRIGDASWHGTHGWDKGVYFPIKSLNIEVELG